MLTVSENVRLAGETGSNRRQPLPRKVFTPTKIAVYLLENKALFPRLISSFVWLSERHELLVTQSHCPVDARGTLSFLGLGVLALIPSWGAMVNDARGHLFDARTWSCSRRWR